MEQNNKLEKLGTNLSHTSVNQVQRYILLSESKKVREIEDFELLDICNKIILVAINSSGSKMPEIEDFKFLVNDLFEDLRTYFAGSPIEDVKEAFRQGSKGMLKETFGINSKAWITWLKTYFSNQDRLNALASKSKPREDKQEPSEEEKRVIEIEFYKTVLIPLFESHKKKQSIIDNHSISFIYSIFLKKRWINSFFDQEIIDQANAIIQDRQRFVYVKSERLTIGTNAYNLEHNRLCKALRVKVAFDKMIEKGFDLEGALLNTDDKN